MYFYINQKEYPHVLYPTMTALPEWTRNDSTVSSSGCGLCSVSMVITNLTGIMFPLIDCLELSMRVNANHSPGTDMDKLAPYVAERFNLNLTMTDDPEILRQHLIKGYMAIANVSGDRPEDDYIGVFSHGGHYVAVVGIDEDREHITLLDPSMEYGKFDEEGRRGKVIVNGVCLHTTITILAEDCKYRKSEAYPEGEFKAWRRFDKRSSHNRYYIFSSKCQNTLSTDPASK